MKQLTSNIMKVGWQKMLDHRMPDGTGLFTDMPQQLVQAFENSFYAGAKHVIDTLVYDAALDEGDEPTEADLSKIDALMHELTEYFTKLGAMAEHDRRSQQHRHNGGH